MSAIEPAETNENRWFAAVVALLAAILFSWSILPTQQHFDYTFRSAAALLHGQLGWPDQPPSWLNETVPAHGTHYSVFPLGAVVSVVPAAILQAVGLIEHFPGGAIGSILVGACVYLLLQLSILQPSTTPRRVVLALFPIFGTWFWANVGFGGAWQTALAFALLGQIGALYFTLVKPRPFIAGAFFALAFGNRTELLVVLPIFLWLWISRNQEINGWKLRAVVTGLRSAQGNLLRFLVVPFVLLVATGLYNFARFGSPFDFGYAQIPDLLEEPWYKHGLFSLYAIPYNVYTMVFAGFQFAGPLPSIQPDGFGCSIFLASPLLFLLFRPAGKHQGVAWIAIATLTLVLWCHGNPGGWQFGYRYAIVLLPWFFLLLLEAGGPKLSIYEATLFGASILINGFAMYLFLWTDQIQVQ